MMDSTDEKIARLYVPLFTDLLCNLRFLELQESIEDKIGRKSPRDTAYQHRESPRTEGAKSPMPLPLRTKKMTSWIMRPGRRGDR